MAKRKDIARYEHSEDFESDLPLCPNCGRKMYIEELCGYRVAHFCKGSGDQVKTDYYDTPEEAVEAYKSGNIKTIKHNHAHWEH